MALHTKTTKFVQKYFSRTPLKHGYEWVVFTSNYKGVLRQCLVVYSEDKPRPKRIKQAINDNDYIVYKLPIRIGKHSSPAIERVCGYAHLDSIYNFVDEPEPKPESKENAKKDKKE